MRKMKTGVIWWTSLVFLACLLGLGTFASAKIYKWEDESGVHYTDDIYKVPPQYRPKPDSEKDEEDKTIRITPGTEGIPSMEENEEIPVEESDLPPEEKETEEPAGMSEEARAALEDAIAFLEKDIERYKTYYDKKSSRRNTKSLKNTLLGTISERNTLAKRLTNIDADAAKDAAGYLQSSISRDEVYKGKRGRVGEGSEVLFKGMLNPIKADEGTKSDLIQKLTTALEVDKELQEAREKENSS